MAEEDETNENDGNTPDSDEKYCKNCGEIIDKEAVICPECGVKQKEDDKQNINVNVENQNKNIQSQGAQSLTSNKSKTLAAILAIFLGGIGIHKLYLGQPVRAIIFFLFSWTGIPFLVGIVQGISYLLMSEQKFAQKFG